MEFNERGMLQLLNAGHMKSLTIDGIKIHPGETPYLPEKRVKIIKAGRNEPCPCGSKKKYKKCCGKNNL